MLYQGAFTSTTLDLLERSSAVCGSVESALVVHRGAKVPCRWGLEGSLVRVSAHGRYRACCGDCGIILHPSFE